MSWLWRGIFLACVAGLIWCGPVLWEVQKINEETVIGREMIVRLLLFVLFLIYVAGYLGALFARWISGKFVDLIMDVNGGWTPPPPQPEADDAELTTEPPRRGSKTRDAVDGKAEEAA